MLNHTAFAAQDFAGIDQHGQEFHVIVLRQTLEWGDDARLRYANSQAPLCESDEYFGVPHASAVRQESDYCHYKPKCDVIVNATAYAPGATATSTFSARLRVRSPGSPPFDTDPSRRSAPSANAATRSVLRGSRGPAATLVADGLLVDKTVRVYGPREFQRRGIPVRFLGLMARVASLGILKTPAWRLTPPAPVSSVPLRPEFAFGGESRIDAMDPAAKRVSARFRLTATQAEACDVLDRQLGRNTIACSSFEANPVGRGFSQPWFLDATRSGKVPAPQVEREACRITSADFQACVEGTADDEFPARLTCGFGVRPKSHPHRRILVGTIDDEFASGPSWLPKDFDFAVWNAAEPDQQCRFMGGGETVELTNMCPRGTPGTVRDAKGDTILALTLPLNECYLLVRLETGEIFTSSMAIDTLIVEPDERRAFLVWRAILARDDEVPVRAVEVMQRTHGERDAQRVLIESLKANKGREMARDSQSATSGGLDG